MNKARLILIALVAALLVALGSYVLYKNTIGNDAQRDDLRALSQLPVRNQSNINLSRVAEGVVPPTNSWMSGMVLNEKPKAVFPMPLSFKPSNDGYEFSLPRVSTSDSLITAPHSAALKARIDGADIFQLTKYDKLSATLTYSSGGKPIGEVIVTEGSPYIYYSALQDSRISLLRIGSPVVSGDSVRFSQDGSDYVAAIFDGGNIEQSANIDITVPKGATLTIYALPKGAKDELKTQAGNVIESVDVEHNDTGDKTNTTYVVKTKNNKPTIFGMLPHHKNASGAKLTAEYATVYGKMSLRSGTAFSYGLPKVAGINTLDITKLSSENKKLLAETIRLDTQVTKLEKEDSYFGAKEMYRAANLLDMARQLGERETAAMLQAKLTKALTIWLSNNKDVKRDKKYFYYDSKLKSIVGETAAFGSEDANDHHFHYGYFIYAASVLGKYDQKFLSDNGAQVGLLVSDIASSQGSDKLPKLRSYDPYMGHGWASGLSPFDDGNNQESSSEAMNAWNAVAAWGSVTNSKALEEHGNWMLSNEINSARNYWLEFDQSKAPYQQYKPSIIALNWGAKRENNTFFSAEPTAKLGIQLIPMNPAMREITTSKDRITKNITEAIPDDNYEKQFSDYILMYQSNVDADTALTKAKSLSDKSIDDANSRSYMYAWIMSQK